MILTIAASDANDAPPSPPWIRSLAFHSFGIYIFHYPVLLLAAACGLSSHGRFIDTLCILATVVICVGLSALFSPTRRAWQSLLTARARV
jgi:peptidoglycan/LPS O-acetylase OafA/YrhL